MENAGGDIRGIAKEIEQMLLCQLYVKDTKAALSRPVCLAYVVSKNWQELYRKINSSLVRTFAFRSIESLCWIVSNNYSETK